MYMSQGFHGVNSSMHQKVSFQLFNKRTIQKGWVAAMSHKDCGPTPTAREGSIKPHTPWINLTLLHAWQHAYTPFEPWGHAVPGPPGDCNVWSTPGQRPVNTQSTPGQSPVNAQPTPNPPDASPHALTPEQL